ncbi:nitrile hydratase subunit beta [Mycobacterium sp. IS-836]|uniref:nitrile hydratase subunit beta n=1 Tax=Mycobacterium sp. IS-836 TaxID=1834160 RepID=UPI00096FBD96|nr:nitrile hydratase subunit beta [Mycobacterium sp. IS-836]OMC54628.1 nitrile hydratase subunit beta [Mycobacterium sp. IS-836]
MNGAHDLGGMQSFGRIPRPQDEPVFHAPWEGRVEAMTMALLVAGHLGGGGVLRYAIESLPPLRYLRDGYFGRHLDGLEGALVDRGLLGPAEIRDRTERLTGGGDPPGGSGDVHSPGTPGPPTRGGEPSNRREADHPGRFAVGDEVIACNIHPRGHTRLPRYVRGRRGVVAHVHSAAVFPDTDAHGMGENPQRVYTVSFDSRELWGDTAEPNLKIQLGLWESYLDPA